MIENNERCVRKKNRKVTERQRKNDSRIEECLFYEGICMAGGSQCIAYAKGSLDNGDSQRAERVVIRNMG